jgi:hypothetical protein
MGRRPPGRKSQIGGVISAFLAVGSGAKENPFTVFPPNGVEVAHGEATAAGIAASAEPTNRAARGYMRPPARSPLAGSHGHFD